MMALTLAGCFAATPPLTYDLVSGSVGPVRRATGRTVVITEPEAVQTYDSARVVVRQAGNLLAYLPEAQLSDTLPRLLQTRLLQTFEASNFPNIGRPDDQLAVDVTLATEIREFEIYVGETTEARVVINAKLVDENRRQIFANRSFSSARPATVEPAPAAIAALDATLQQVMAEILQWTARNA